MARAVDLPLRLPTVMMSIVQPAGEESGPIPRARATTAPAGRSPLCFTITLLLAGDCPGMLACSGTCRKQHRGRGASKIVSRGCTILFAKVSSAAAAGPAPPRMRAASRLGGAPNRRRYSRLNWDGLWYPTRWPTPVKSVGRFATSNLAAALFPRD